RAPARGRRGRYTDAPGSWTLVRSAGRTGRRGTLVEYRGCTLGFGGFARFGPSSFCVGGRQRPTPAPALHALLFPTPNNLSPIAIPHPQQLSPIAIPHPQQPNPHVCHHTRQRIHVHRVRIEVHDAGA